MVHGALGHTELGVGLARPFLKVCLLGARLRLERRHRLVRLGQLRLPGPHRSLQQSLLPFEMRDGGAEGCGRRLRARLGGLRHGLGGACGGCRGLRGESRPFQLLRRSLHMA